MSEYLSPLPPSTPPPHLLTCLAEVLVTCAEILHVTYTQRRPINWEQQQQLVMKTNDVQAALVTHLRCLPLLPFSFFLSSSCSASSSACCCCCSSNMHALPWAIGCRATRVTDLIRDANATKCDADRQTEETPTYLYISDI